MSVSFSCHCPERKKPVKERAWVVVTRCGSNSAFNGWRWKSGDYSEVRCRSCGAMGRTKAQYVRELRDDKRGDWEDDVQRANWKAEAEAEARLPV